MEETPRPRTVLPPLLLDAGLASGVFLLVVVTGAPPAPAPLGYLLAVAQLLPVLVRRRWPLPSALAVAAGALVQVAEYDSPSPSNLAVPLAVYAVAAYEPTPTRRRAVLLLSAVGCLVAALDWGSRYGASQLVFLRVFFAGGCLAVCAAAWAWGLATFRRNELVASLAARAAAAERERDQQARIAAQQERTTIAREMHDIVAHSLAVVVMQADGAAFAATRSQDPGTATRTALEALTTISATARDALAQTRRLVSVLRDSETPLDLSPSEGLADLGALVEGVRSAGMPVELDMPAPGQADHVDTGVSLVAYRVVQESLTNIVKHAGPSVRAHVRVVVGPRDIEVSVSDDGRGAAADPSEDGHGLVGLAERVAVVGGRFTAGPTSAGGFMVRAWLPVDTTGGSDDR